MGRAFEVKPLLVAAGIGAAGLFILSRGGFRGLLLGAALGASVQAGVRLAGVS